MSEDDKKQPKKDSRGLLVVERPDPFPKEDDTKPGRKKPVRVDRMG